MTTVQTTTRVLTVKEDYLRICDLINIPEVTMIELTAITTTYDSMPPFDTEVLEHKICINKAHIIEFYETIQ